MLKTFEGGNVSKYEENKWKEEYEGGWIGVDLDGTLARYDGWKSPEHIGEPLMPMVNRVKQWLAEGRKVKIMTARVCPDIPEWADNSVERATAAIEKWCMEVFGQVLPCTSMKDYNMIELWDDRAIQV